MTCEEVQPIYFHLEDQRSRPVKTSSVACGTCPFRGQLRVNGQLVQVRLDERCPEYVPVRQVKRRHTHRLYSIHDPQEKGEPIGWHGDPPLDVAVLKNDSYCGTCVHDMVREKELGMAVRTARVSSTKSVNRFRPQGGRRRMAKKLATQLRRSK